MFHRHADVIVSTNTVSRLHAAIVHHSDGRIYLIDLKSTHGTLLDDQRVAYHKPTKLQDGQVRVCLCEFENSTHNLRKS